IPQRPPRIAALDAAVEVVPMIEHAPLQPRFLIHVQLVDGPQCLDQAKEVKSAIERADLAAGRDHSYGVSAKLEGTNAESFRPKICQLTLPFETGDQR